MGSRDRKLISTIVYRYFRCASGLLPNADLQTAIIQSYFLCANESSDFLKFHFEELDINANLPWNEKLKILNLHSGDLFKHQELLSPKINAAHFCASMLIQPDLFIRIRPGKKALVLQKLDRSGISYVIEDEHCIRLHAAQDLKEILKIDREVVVQDSSSQHALDYFKGMGDPNMKSLEVWDGCAASGGKSILLHDLLDGRLKLTVSDVRQQILHNLRSRFQLAGLSCQAAYIADLCLKSPMEETQKFDIVICDAPCTGSGTWARTPEQYYSFEPAVLEAMVEKQSKILGNILPHVKPGGYLAYITCSVFEKENECQLAQLTDSGVFELMEMRYCVGYQKKADTLFVAVLQRKG